MATSAAPTQPTTKSLGNLLKRVEAIVGIDTHMLAMIGALLIIWITFAGLTEGIFLTPRNLCTARL